MKTVRFSIEDKVKTLSVCLHRSTRLRCKAKIMTFFSKYNTHFRVLPRQVHQKKTERDRNPPFFAIFALPKNSAYEPRNPPISRSEHHLQHHGPPYGYREFRRRRTPGQLRSDDRGTRHRRIHLQLHLLELQLRAHGYQRTHGAGFRCRKLPRMHQHARPGHSGRSDPRPAGYLLPKPSGATGTMGHERQRNRTRLFLRPHLGGTRRYHALRIQRLVHRHAECRDPDVYRRHGEYRTRFHEPVARIRTRHGHHGHRLWLGRGPKYGGPAGGPAAYPAIPQNSHTVYVA